MRRVRFLLALTGSMMTRGQFGFLSLVMLALLAPSVIGQSYTATILGTIRDTSAGVLPGVTVTVENPATGFKRAAITDDVGNYVFQQLPVGTYSVAAELTGFGKQVAPAFTVHVAQEARLDFTLEIGEVSQTIDVAAAAPVVQTDDSSIGTVVQERSIISLPLDGRDYTQLAALAPGVTAAGSNGWSSTVAINGNRGGKTEFLIDGSANTETWYGGALLSPSVDAIAEFRVQSNMSAAEYGRGAGWINAVTKSGTNQFHGALYEFHRNDAIDARNFFAQEKPKLIRNQFGGSVGGPILKDQLFFYFDYEGTRERQERVSNVRVPTAPFREGDFSSVSTAVLDPTTRQPFPGNVIPASRISPIARYFQAFVPGPNSGSDRLILNTPAPINQDQASIRVDRQGLSTRITGRYILGKNERENAGGGQIYGRDNTLGLTVQDVATHNASVNINHTFNPNLLFDFRTGYYYNHFFQYTPSDQGANHTVESGIGGFAETTAGLGHGGFPYISMTSYGGIPGGLYLDIKPKQEVQSYIASLSWIKNVHSLKFGLEHRRELGTTRHYNLAKGVFSFSGMFTGDPYADFLLGHVNYTNRSFPQDLSGSRTNLLHFYVQDDWKVHPRLTLNVGVRFEYNPFPTPLRSGSNFDPDLGKVVVASKNGQIDFFSEVGPFAYNWRPDWYVKSEDVGAPFSLVESAGGWFNPRLGFAWRPFGGTATVIRGGTGIFTVPIQQQIGRGGPIVNPPWVVSEFLYSGVPTDWGTLWAPITQENGFQAPLVTAMDKKFYNAYSAQWNLTVERRLPAKSSIAVGYVGNKSTHLQLNNNLNQPKFGPNAWSEIPFPEFGAFAQALQTRGDSNYHSLQAKWDKQLTHGLSVLSSYSWSKTIDTVSADNAFVKDRFNIHLDRGLSSLDTGHRFVTSFVYDLPFHSDSLLVRRLAEGWRFSGIATFQSGPPFEVMSTYDTSGFWVMNGQRADRTGNGKLDNPTVEKWFDTQVFQLGSQYTIGTAGRNILRADGTSKFDLGLHRDFRFAEDRYVQFRLESFNAFNHPTFGAPFATIGLPDSGRVTSAGPARVMQAALKFYF